MQLTDGDRIRGLLGAYCRLIDAGDFAGVCAHGGRSAAHRGRDRAGDRSRRGRGALRRRGPAARDGTPGTQHVVANTTFGEPAADGSITATSAYLVFQAVADVPLQPIITGTYVDAFAPDRAGPGWHFTERRFGIGRSGVLDHHLTITL